MVGVGAPGSECIKHVPEAAAVVLPVSAEEGLIWKAPAGVVKSGEVTHVRSSGATVESRGDPLSTPPRCSGNAGAEARMDPASAQHSGLRAGGEVPLVSYFNPHSNVSDTGADAPADASDVLNGPPSPGPLPEGWQEVVSRSTEKVYYGHVASGLTTWVRPKQTEGETAETNTQEEAPQSREHTQEQCGRVQMRAGVAHAPSDAMSVHARSDAPATRPGSGAIMTTSPTDERMDAPPPLSAQPKSVSSPLPPSAAAGSSAMARSPTIDERMDAPSPLNAYPKSVSAPLPPSEVAALRRFKPERANHDDLMKMWNGLDISKRAVLQNWHIPRRDIRLFEEIGRGSGGVVHLAKWCGLQVAAKTLHRVTLAEHDATIIDEATARKDLLNEMCLLSTLRHPNLVLFLGGNISESDSDTSSRMVGRTQSGGETIVDMVLVSEYLEGGNLEQFVRRTWAEKKAWSPGKEKILNWAVDLARGLSFLHNCTSGAIVHRDLKPSNLMMDRAGTRLKLCDFGLSKLLHRVSHESYIMTGNTGSYRYMAPEVFNGSSYDEAVDIYSAGMLIYFMATGAPPMSRHEGKTAAVLASQRHRPCLMAVKKTCSPQLAEMISKCWLHEPNRRPSALQVYEDLELCSLVADAKRANKSSSSFTTSHSPSWHSPRASSLNSTASSPRTPRSFSSSFSSFMQSPRHWRQTGHSTFSHSLGGLFEGRKGRRSQGWSGRALPRSFSCDFDKETAEGTSEPCELLRTSSEKRTSSARADASSGSGTSMESSRAGASAKSSQETERTSLGSSPPKSGCDAFAMEALLCQYILGPCTEKAPTLLRIKARRKHAAWSALGDMTRSDAKSKLLSLFGRSPNTVAGSPVVLAGGERASIGGLIARHLTMTM